MPLYEYRCQTCGNSFEMLRRMSDADRDLLCPKCASEEVERQISGFATGGCGPSGSGGRFT
jgi:putative FmdB family regulatory protein